MTVFFADETTRKEFGFERHTGFAGENNIARGIIDARNEGIGTTGVQETHGVFEAVGWDKIDIWEGFDSLFSVLIGGDFGKDDFHKIIIAYQGWIMVQ